MINFMKLTLGFYKRNLGLRVIGSFNSLYSTNKYNNKMEESNQLAAKIEEIQIAGKAQHMQNKKLRSRRQFLR